MGFDPVAQTMLRKVPNQRHSFNTWVSIGEEAPFLSALVSKVNLSVGVHLCDLHPSCLEDNIAFYSVTSFQEDDINK